jgi:hypothetical protein
VTKAILILATLAPLAIWAQPRGGTLPRGQSGPVQGKPLSAVEVYRTTQVLADGTHVDKTNSSQFYRDAQGRMRSESPAHVLIFDPVAGFTYSLNIKQKTYFRDPMPERTAFEWIAAEANGTHVSSTSANLSGDPGASYSQYLAQRNLSQQLTEELHPQIVCRVPAKGSRITIIIPAGAFGNDRDVKVVNERWYSDDLKVLLKSSNSDPRFGVTTYELTQIVQAPPNPALFQLPADYTQRFTR